MFKRVSMLPSVIPLFLVLVLSSCSGANPRIDIDAIPNNNWIGPYDIYNKVDIYVVQHSY